MTDTLRYVMRPSPLPHLGEGVGEMRPVLQCRQKTGENEWGFPIYGEWKDVPTVEEPTT